MTFYNGRLFAADAPTGPFLPVAQNHEFLIDEDESGSIFPRLWGELYTGDKELALLTHQQCVDRFNPCYAGLVKRAILGDDGVLRAGWWANNDVLKSAPLSESAVPASWPRSAASNFSKRVTECAGDCMGSGLWLEGSLRIPPVPGQAVGIWLETVIGVPHSNATTTTGFQFLVDGAGRFRLQGGQGEAQNGGKVIDRAMGSTLKPNATVPFRLLARNAWSGQGLTEHYVADVLSLAQTLRGHLSGAFATVGEGVQVTSVNRLSLPEDSSRLKNDDINKQVGCYWYYLVSNSTTGGYTNRTLASIAPGSCTYVDIGSICQLDVEDAHGRLKPRVSASKSCVHDTELAVADARAAKKRLPHLKVRWMLFPSSNSTWVEAVFTSSDARANLVKELKEWASSYSDVVDGFSLDYETAPAKSGPARLRQSRGLSDFLCSLKMATGLGTNWWGGLTRMKQVVDIAAVRRCQAIDFIETGDYFNDYSVSNPHSFELSETDELVQTYGFRPAQLLLGVGLSAFSWMNVPRRVLPICAYAGRLGCCPGCSADEGVHAFASNPLSHSSVGGHPYHAYLWDQIQADVAAGRAEKGHSNRTRGSFGPLSSYWVYYPNRSSPVSEPAGELTFWNDFPDLDRTTSIVNERGLGGVFTWVATSDAMDWRATRRLFRGLAKTDDGVSQPQVTWSPPMTIATSAECYLANAGLYRTGNGSLLAMVGLHDPCASVPRGSEAYTLTQGAKFVRQDDSFGELEASLLPWLQASRDSLTFVSNNASGFSPPKGTSLMRQRTFSLAIDPQTGRLTRQEHLKSLTFTGLDFDNSRSNASCIGTNTGAQLMLSGSPLNFVLLSNGERLAVFDGDLPNASRGCTNPWFSNPPVCCHNALFFASTDGVAWTFRGSLGARGMQQPSNGPGPDGSMVELGDGRILAVFRQINCGLPLTQAWSSTQGRSWTTPRDMKGIIGTVGPQLLRLDSGALLLASGRVGIGLAVALDSSGERWKSLNIAAAFNKQPPSEADRFSDEMGAAQPCDSHPCAMFAGKACGNKIAGEGTSYVSMVASGRAEVTLAFDRFNGPANTTRGGVYAMRFG